MMLGHVLLLDFLWEGNVGVTGLSPGFNMATSASAYGLHVRMSREFRLCSVFIIFTTSRPQWPSDLRHELSSLARTLGSWVPIPLKAWMSVCVYSVCVVLCVSSGLATGWSPVQGVLPTVYRIKKLKKRQRSNKWTAEPLIETWMDRQISTIITILN
jgi:hypothetical protein